ncbi:MAG: hypothetical protein ABIZ04_04925 [Opitutus sp.]
MQIAANPPPPPPPIAKVKPPSFFVQQNRYRKQAKAWALLIHVIGCVMTWCFGFVVIGALLFYLIFLSRLLPHQLTELLAYVLDPAGSLIGVSITAVLFTAGLWWFVSRIFTQDTSAGLIWRIGVRLPDPDDLAEEQWVQLSKEMAARAGMPMPAVLVFDRDGCNAALIGDRPEGAGVLVSRDLANGFDADETRAVIAQLLASAINGDLFLTGAMLRVLYAMGISFTLLDWPFSPGARKTLRVLRRYARPSAEPSSALPPEDVGDALTCSLQPDGLDSLTIFLRKMIGEETDLRSIAGTVLLVPLLPLILLRLAVGIAYGLTSLFVLSPLLALVLRSRRRRADATAVQLTKNADAMARALIRLDGGAHIVAGAMWSEMNLVVGHGRTEARPFERLQARVARAITTMNNFSHRLRDSARPVASAAPQADSAIAGHNYVFGFHPPLGTRIMRLKKLGAEVAWTEVPDRSSWIIAAVPTAVVAILLLILFA